MPRRKSKKSKSKPKTRSSPQRRLKKPKSAVSPRRRRRRRVTFRGLLEDMEQFETWFLPGLDSNNVILEYLPLAMLKKKLKDNIDWPTQKVTKALNKLRKTRPFLFQLWDGESTLPEGAILDTFEGNIQLKVEFLNLFNKLFKNTPPQLSGPSSSITNSYLSNGSLGSLGSLEEELNKMNIGPMNSSFDHLPQRNVTLPKNDESEDEDDEEYDDPGNTNPKRPRLL